MYLALVIVQCIGVAILLFGVLYTFRQRPSKLTTLFLMIMATSFINSLGYLLEMISTSASEAMICNKLSYWGKTYETFLLFIFVATYCGVKIPKLVSSSLFAFHTLIAVLVLTSEHHTLYYTSIGFNISTTFPHLVLGHGVFYFIYTIVSLMYMILIPIICILRYRSVSNKSEKRQLIILIVATLIPLLGYVTFLFNITGGYDGTSIGQFASAFILFISFIRTKFFDTLELAKDSVFDNLDDGIVVLDNANKLLYANQTAISIFPELEYPSTKQIVDYILTLLYSRENYIKNQHVYSCKMQVIYSKNVVRGKMILLNDITASYNYTRNLESAIAERTEELKYIQSTVITSLASMIEARDGVTGHHVKRTSAYVQIVAQALKRQGYYPDELTDENVMNIIQAAPLHDIGKIAIPDSILCKPGKLTDEEFDIIKTHPAIGANMIEEILREVEHGDYLQVARDVANYHHEKWNGTGYPCGLKGKEIPLPARIMAITDVFEALISERPYKKGFSYEKSVEIIKEGSGQHFDPIIVDVFLSVIDEIKAVG